MARYTKKHHDEESAAATEAEPEGSSGAPPEDQPNVEKTIVPAGGLVVGRAAKPFERRDAPRPRSYRVVGGPPQPNGAPPQIMYDGMRVPMRIGKIVEDTAYDLKKLVDQGIQLEEILPPDEQEPPQGA